MAWLAGLSAAVVVSLGLNVWLLVRQADTRQRVDEVAFTTAVIVDQAGTLQRRLGALGPALGEGLDEAIAELAAFEDATLTFTVDVDQRVPISASVPFQRTLTVPVNTVLPIDEVIETTIDVQGPLGLDIPIGVEVPIRLDLPIDLTLEFPIDETIDVDTTIELDLAVPISVPVAGTDLASLATGLRSGLEALRDALGTS
jgi:hypothetical protein